MTSSVDNEVFRYVTSLLIPTSSNILVHQGGVWKFQGITGVVGLDLNRGFDSRDAAMDYLVQAISSGYTPQENRVAS